MSTTADTGSMTLQQMRNTPSYKAHLDLKRKATIFALQQFLELEEASEHTEGRKVCKLVDEEFEGKVAGSLIVGEAHAMGFLEFDMSSKSASPEGGSKFYKLTNKGRKELRKHLDPSLKVQAERKQPKKSAKGDGSQPEQE